MQNTRTSNDVILELHNISKSFGDKKVLNNISLKFKKHERIAIIGVNGCGKTTLMEIATGLQKATSGTITYNFENGKTEKNAVGMQFQDSNAPTALRIRDVLKYVTSSFGISMESKKIQDYIDTFGLRDILDTAINKLSGGQKQRVNLMISIIHDPQLLIFDELSTGLDIKGRIELMEEIKKLQEKLKATLVIISHSPDEIELLADRIIHIKNGRIHEDLTKQEILKRYHNISNFLISVVVKNG